MIKYMVHACKSRMWYVDEYIMPSLVEQGIDADVWIDNTGKSRTAYMESFSSIKDEGITWHLQDDIIICGDFKERTSNLDENSVYCGFCSKYDADAKNDKHIGKVSVKNMWYSFPCIAIPNKVAVDFVRWFERKETQYKYQAYMQYEKYEDELFRFYLIDCVSGIDIFNIKPNLVDHVDYLLGGSTINGQRREKITSLYFDDKWRINDLENKINSKNQFTDNI